MLGLVLSPLHINLLYADYNLKNMYYYYQSILQTTQQGQKITQLAHGPTTSKERSWNSN